MAKFIAVALFLAVFNGAFGDKITNLNNATDKWLTFANDWQTYHGLGLRPIPPMRNENITLTEGFFLGANSVHRIGDATLNISSDDVSHLDFTFGYRLFIIAYGKMILPDVLATSAVFDVKKNAFRFGYSYKKGTACKVTVDNYAYSYLKDVIMKTTSADYQEVDVSDTFEKHVVPTINAKLQVIKPYLEAELTLYICRHARYDQYHIKNLFDIMERVLNKHM